MPTPSEAGPLPLLTREGKVWLALTLGLFVTGLYKGINLLLLLSYMLAGLPFVNGLVVRRSVRALTARREWGTPVQAGEPADWRVILENGSGDVLRGFRVAERIGGREMAWAVERLAPRGRAYLRETVAFASRGRHPLGPLRVVTRFPFGLAQRGIDLSDSGEVVVLPRLGSVRMDAFRRWLARASRGEGTSRQRRPLRTPKQADLHGLRPFRTGDSPRWIDWKSTARRRELITREFEDDAPPRLLMIVEAWLPANPTAAERQRLEDILSLAGTLCRDWCADPGNALRLIVLEESSQSDTSGGGVDRIWDLIGLLAPLRGVAVPAALEAGQVGRRCGSTDSLVAITSNPNSRLSDEAAQLFRQPVARLCGIEGLDWYAISAPAAVR